MYQLFRERNLNILLFINFNNNDADILNTSISFLNIQI